MQKTNMDITINCLGVKTEDIKVTQYGGELVPDELEVKVKYPPNDFGMVNQTFEFSIPAKFDLDNLSLKMNNGKLSIKIPLKGGIAKEIKIKE